MYRILYKRLIRPKLFAIDPEDAHDRTTELLRKISHRPLLLAMIRACLVVRNRQLERVIMDIRFPNPVGLAAGFSKYAIGLPALEAIGFGFIELGGVTPLPQDGNPKPRVLRDEEREALINRMGFNNPGADALKQAIRGSLTPRVPIGINLGKGKDTPLESAADDYCGCLEALYQEGDFFVVNVSSPNTPGLRTLQKPETLNRILAVIAKKRQRLTEMFGGKKPRPVLVKIAPDLDFGTLDRIVECVQRNNLDGLVIANTTTSRVGLTSKYKDEAGGVSGRPLFYRSLSLISHAKWLAPDLTVIGVGGIFSSKDAWSMIHESKADLVQVYTGLVYEGPGLVREINKGLLANMRQRGYSSLEDAR